MKINPFEVDENVNYIHPGVSNDRDISSSFPRSKSNFVRFLTKLSHDKLKENRSRGNVYTQAHIYIYIYIRITAGAEPAGNND